jgi:glutathione S-transferase
MGEQFTVADAYLFTMTSWMVGDGVDMEQFPKLADHFRRKMALPAVKKIAPLHGITA